MRNSEETRPSWSSHLRASHSITHRREASPSGSTFQEAQPILKILTPKQSTNCSNAPSSGVNTRDGEFGFGALESQFQENSWVWRSFCAREGAASRAVPKDTATGSPSLLRYVEGSRIAAHARVVRLSVGSHCLPFGFAATPLSQTAWSVFPRRNVSELNPASQTEEGESKPEPIQIRINLSDPAKKNPLNGVSFIQIN